MLSDRDRQIIFKLVEELTGATQTGDSRQDSLLANVERRMNELNMDSLAVYLKYVDSSPAELAQLVSALTIHTTSWFRENPHFVAFQEILLDAVKKNEVFKVWCAACSTGEEVYSFALLMEEFRRVNPTFDYRIVGTDIDALSVKVAERAVYNKKNMGFHVIRYKSHILEGSGKTEDFFTLSKEIRDRCTFRVHDLRNTTLQKEAPFHMVICRNVLIYFSRDTVGRVISNLLVNMRTEGHCMLGHSEAINGHEFGLTQLGHSIYTKRIVEERNNSRIPGKYRILSVDDSASTRKYLEQTLTELGFESLTVSSASEATNYLNFNDVDLITLDLKMPGISGDKWLQLERKEGLKTPVVILSDVHASDAKEVVELLAMGAQDYLEKERLRAEPKKAKETFVEIIRSSVQTSPSIKVGGSFPTHRPAAILVGASTGGPQALVKMLTDIPKTAPPIFITQHMSPKFMRPLGERLSYVSGLTLSDMTDGEPLRDGVIYMALGDYHIGIGDEKGQLVLRLNSGPAFNGHRPSVDFMFNSALGLKWPVMAVLMTGMGRDGALGLRFLRKEGAFCIAQSEEDCVVYGMPKEAIERDGADFVGNVDEIRALMLDSFVLRRKAS